MDINVEWQNCKNGSTAKVVSPLKSVVFDGNYFLLDYNNTTSWPVNPNDIECYACYLVKRNDKWVGNIFSKLEAHPILVDAHELIYMSKDINRPIRGETIGFCLLSSDQTIRSNYYFSKWI
jgi:hypothetical protein